MSTHLFYCYMQDKFFYKHVIFLLWFHNPDALLVDNDLVDNGF